MIFITAGTQAPFDRLIKIIDELAPIIGEDIIAQAPSSNYKPKNIKLIGLVTPEEYKSIFYEATLIVSHAGIGTIVSALSSQKPIVIFPRFACFGEHRDDHQLVTAMRMNKLGYVHVAYDKKQLFDLLNNREMLQPLKTIGECASEKLISDIVEFINNR